MAKRCQLGERRPSHQRVLDHFQANPGDTVWQAAQTLSLTYLTLTKYIHHLREEGAIQRQVRWVVSQ